MDAGAWTWARRALGRATGARDDEIGAALLGGAYFFFLLASFYAMRPLREEMGVSAGVENLPWLFMGTLGAMVLIQPMFGALASRTPRRVFIPLANRFFALHIVCFYLYFALSEHESVWAQRGFYVWLSVFNLFVVSVFWALMADVFRSEQGRRLFPFIGLGGTAGAIVGGSLTAALVGVDDGLSAVTMLLIALALLECATWCALALMRHARRSDAPIEPVAPEAFPDEGPPAAPLRAEAMREGLARGGTWGGLKAACTSPYLLLVCAYVLLFTVGSTFLYFEQARIVNDAFETRDARTRAFALIDVLSNVLTVLLQAFVAGRLIRRIGVGWTLALLPLVTIAGFVALLLAPVYAVIVTVQTARRATNYAIARPAKEILFTVVPRDEKYKAKNFIDTFVYRGGDALGAGAYQSLKAAATGLATTAGVAIALSVAWIFVGLGLGRALKKREAAGG